MTQGLNRGMERTYSREIYKLLLNTGKGAGAMANQIVPGQVRQAIQLNSQQAQVKFTLQDRGTANTPVDLVLRQQDKFLASHLGFYVGVSDSTSTTGGGVGAIKLRTFADPEAFTPAAANALRGVRQIYNGYWGFQKNKVQSYRQYAMLEHQLVRNRPIAVEENNTSTTTDNVLTYGQVPYEYGDGLVALNPLLLLDGNIDQEVTVTLASTTDLNFGAVGNLTFWLVCEAKGFFIDNANSVPTTELAFV